MSRPRTAPFMRRSHPRHMQFALWSRSMMRHSTRANSAATTVSLRGNLAYAQSSIYPRDILASVMHVSGEVGRYVRMFDSLRVELRCWLHAGFIRPPSPGIATAYPERRSIDRYIACSRVFLLSCRSLLCDFTPGEPCEGHRTCWQSIPVPAILTLTYV